MPRTWTIERPGSSEREPTDARALGLATSGYFFRRVAEAPAPTLRVIALGTKQPRRERAASRWKRQQPPLLLLRCCSHKWLSGKAGAVRRA